MFSITVTACADLLVTSNQKDSSAGKNSEEVVICTTSAFAAPTSEEVNWSNNSFSKNATTQSLIISIFNVFHQL